MKVAIYLRVSTLDQATKGNTNRDGFSIPAQREACRRKADNLKATVVREYIDRGESARSTTSRPALQRLLADLCQMKNFDYVIVHKIDRLARNLHDDVMIGLAIKKGGAQLVSVTENIDETPSGQLLHGIMASIAEFYSRNLGAEALKGATEKAKQGGTPFCAPIGYTNIIERINHREIRTVIPDAERAPLITLAFELYATGDYSELRLCEELARRGLRSRLRARSAIASISPSGLDKILSNRYYLGYVKYCGIEYKGKHQPLVTPAVFAAAQAVRANHSHFASKSHKHKHYLSRLLVCGLCKRPLCFSISKHKYPYFFCMNRRDTGCPQPYVPVYLIEKVIIDALNQKKFSDAQRQQLASLISKELNCEQRRAENEIKRQKQRLTRLQIEQENLLQAYYAKVLDSDLMKSEQKRITREMKPANEIILEAEKRLAIVNGRKDRALELARGLNIVKTYSKASPIIRRHFCQALFSEIAIKDKVTYASAIENCRCVKDHQVTIEINWHNPINTRHLTEAILALSLERK